MAIVSIGKIVIIQSLREGDKPTGSLLRDDIEPLNIIRAKPLEIEFVKISTKLEFLSFLEKITNTVDHDGKHPILHIETHGDREGLKLSSGERVTWSDIRDPLTKINIATKCNLLVNMASCHGAALVKTIKPSDIAPCWGMIGPVSTTFPDKILSGFKKFYEELLNDEDGDTSKAIRYLNTNLFVFKTAEWLFQVVCRGYFSKYGTDEGCRQQAKKVFRILKNDPTPGSRSIGNIKRRLKNNSENYFNVCKKIFFMIDKYPENRKRFTISYKDVVKGD